MIDENEGCSESVDGLESDSDNAASEIGTGVEFEDTSGVEILEPFNPALIRIETKRPLIDSLLRLMRRGEIDLAPGFQRKGGLWSNAAQSRLIESILIRIPLPAFYMDATDEFKWLVVDGLQRLTALKRFIIEQKLRLEGLDFLKDLQGKTFSQLPRNYQRRIEQTEVTAYFIEKGTPDEVKFEIFKRINTGGLPLSPQEIRHALNQGPAAKMLERLAASKEFQLATAEGIHDDRMADRECVLRFLAFAQDGRLPRTDLDVLLHKRMDDLNKMPEKELQRWEDRFKRAMEAAMSLFGNDAFRKRYKERDRRRPINKALFEVWSVTLDRLSDQQVEVLIKRRDQVRRKFRELMNNTTLHDEKYTFDLSISQGTGDAAKVRIRYGCIERLVEEVLA